MSTHTVRWSWLGLVAGALTASAILLGSLWAIYPFRTGLDADTPPPPFRLNWLWEVPMAVGLLAPLASLFILAGWWAAKLARRRWLSEVVTVGLPVALVIGLRVASIIAWRNDPLNGKIKPFDADRILYLPNYLEILALVVAFGLAALSFHCLAGRSTTSHP